MCRVLGTDPPGGPDSGTVQTRVLIPRASPLAEVNRALYTACVADSGKSQNVLAVITYPAPHGIEAETLCGGDIVAFGRGADCRVRFGYAPQPDKDVPRVAGHFVVMNNRVFIESSATVGHRALEVRTSDRTVQIPIGEGYSPRDMRFDVMVRGQTAPWKLGVTVRLPSKVSRDLEAADPPTAHYTLELSEFQRAVLDAYFFQPIRQGRVEPATHREAAGDLNYHPNTVREALYEIWTLMFEQGVPMPDISDKRVAVIEAARIHGMFTVES